MALQVNQPAADLQREKRAQGEDETEIEEDNAGSNAINRLFAFFRKETFGMLTF